LSHPGPLSKKKREHDGQKKKEKQRSTKHTHKSGFVNYKKGCTRLAISSDKVYQLFVHDRWFSPGTLASSTTKTGRHDIAEILLKQQKSNQSQALYRRRRENTMAKRKRRNNDLQNIHIKKMMLTFPCNET
jgi:hypothetical protein